MNGSENMSDFERMLIKVSERREKGRQVYGDGIYQEPYEYFYWMIMNKVKRFEILSKKPHEYTAELKDTALDLAVYAVCLMEKIEDENRAL